MRKSGVLILFLFLMLVVSVFNVNAQDDSVESEGGSGGGGQGVAEEEDEVTGDGGEGSGDVKGEDEEKVEEEDEIEDGDELEDEDDELDEEEEFDEEGLEDITEEEINEELGDGGSVNVFDRFFDGLFQNDLENMKERFAEIRTLVREGKIDEAKDLLEHYREVANRLEVEVSPEDKGEAVRLSRIIKRAVEEMEDLIDDADRGDFDEISDSAEKVGKAAEIAEKIRDLCKQLHELGAWDEFERACKNEDDGPRWQEDFFKGLTEEQKKEAEKFGRILSQCMRTSGEDCDCADIPHEGMAAMCFEAAPLARACDIEDDEAACDQLDALEFPDDLPRHLEEALFRVEDEYGDASFDHHIPGPCRDAGISGRERGDRERCFEIMVELEAPLECRDAIKEAGVKDERGAREVCEKIMFEIHAPQECVEAGITNPGDCAEFFGEEFGPRGEFDRRGPDRGPDCRGIEDVDERLKCYEGAENHYDDRFEDRRGPNGGPPGGWPGPCRDAEAFTRESCERIMRAEGDKRFEETKEEERMCAERCEAEGKAWDFSFGCRCFGGRDDGNFRDFERHDDFEDRNFRDFDEFDRHDDFDDFDQGDFDDEGFDGEGDDFDGGGFDSGGDFGDDSGFSGDEGSSGDFGGDSGESGDGDSGFDSGDFGGDRGESGDGDSGFDSGDSGGDSGSDGGEDGGSFGGGDDSGGSGGGDSGGSSGGDSGGSGGDSGGSGDSGGGDGGSGFTGGVITGNAFLDYFYY
jgi:hypothetical protein